MKTTILTTLAITTLLTATTSFSQQQLATSIKETRAETTRTSDQLKATLAALTGLTKQKQGDLPCL